MDTVRKVSFMTLVYLCLITSTLFACLYDGYVLRTISGDLHVPQKSSTIYFQNIDLSLTYTINRDCLSQ
jgi:hypothetical protein